jgi:serine 3-dehydrogenase
MLDLRNRIVCITGASAGIGKACAEAFAEQNARLLLCARRDERLKTIAEELKLRFGVYVHTFTLDVRNADEVARQFGALPVEWQDIDVLVNNAGLSRALDPVYENEISDIDQMVDTNVKGLLYVTRAVVPGMVERNRGHVINIGSTAGHGVYPGGVVYCATKHAVKAISEGLKMDVHGTAVRVTSVDPGLTNTEFSTVRFSGDRDRADATYTGMTPLKAEDIADAVVYCATRPAHVNVADLILMPVDQSGTTMVNRRSR